ncbi:hypothetical protein BGY98DRAFT_1089185 [Russula aff. rugulosa BPL654]|nr:hypothetical protein BGY98DRAFT_1089185 [Russula aff. rugulosa BPL654]
MESLRSRASTRKGPKPAAKLSKPEKNVRKSRVDDRIKKRMSTRYATISSPTPADGTPPSVPTIPLGLRGPDLDIIRERDEVARQQAPSKEDLRAMENKLLDVEDFDPDAYLKLKLANSTEAELRSLQSSLQNSKDEVAADLQRNVFKNYAQFVFISKEIGTLENDMMELKESLSEWKSMPSVLHIEESASVADRRRNVRSSVADLRILYANQMQNLHAQIEGSAKFVPTTPGRHVVAEIDGILALNAATYKPMSTVRFVLLDDAVLVARKRRRRNASESDKLVADRCWPLNEMLVLDTKDTATLVNVFKVKHGKETHVYRTDSASDKKNMLAQFRHIAEELSAKRRKEREGEHERRKSLWAGGGGRGLTSPGEVPPVPDWMTDLVQHTGMNDSAKEVAERDARWIGDFADQLTVAIALREWDTAVDLVEQGQAKLNSMPLLAAKLNPLATSLVSALLQALSYPHNHKEVVKKLISLLIRLDAGAAARTTFLAARTETARRLVRMIRFDGHIGTYISELAISIFTVIKHTADWFLASFRENEVAGSFIEWARSLIETFAEMFRIQVFGTDVDESVVEEARNITHNQSRKHLQEFGLDFRFILDALLVPNPPDSGNISPAVPILAPAPKPSLQASSKTPVLPPRPTRSSVVQIAEPASESAHSSPAAPDLPIRWDTPTPVPSAADSPARTARNAPVPPPVPSTSQRSYSPSAQQLSPSPVLTPQGRRTRSPFPPPSSSSPSTSTSASMSSRPSTPSRGTSASSSPATSTTVPPALGLPPTPQATLVSPTPMRPGVLPPTSSLGRGAGGTLPLSMRGPNPAPPPRSRERSERERERPPPVSVPRREGYF